VSIALGILYAHLAFFIFAIIAFFYQRIRYKQRLRRGKRRLGFYPSAAAMGNALQSLQSIAEPTVALILEEKLAEPAESDDESGDDDPLAHLHRQAARIRKGDPPNRLTARLKPPR